jgi:hypothetical protein
MMYGMTTAQISSESTISGMHFVTLLRLLAPPKEAAHTDGEDDLEELTRTDAPFGFVHSFFALLVALTAAVKLIYALFT